LVADTLLKGRDQFMLQMISRERDYRLLVYLPQITCVLLGRAVIIEESMACE
jgi:hypothetical protein